MRVWQWRFLAAGVVPIVLSRAPRAPASSLRLIDLAEAPEHHVERTVVVDVVEPISSYDTGVERWVEIPELGSQLIALVPVAPTDVPPLCVRGEFRRRTERPWFARGEANRSRKRSRRKPREDVTHVSR